MQPQPKDVTQGRQDTSGHWHTVMVGRCDECGCTYEYSVDEPGLIWEAGERVEKDCLDPMCDCHVMPIRGLCFKLHLAS